MSINKIQKLFFFPVLKFSIFLCLFQFLFQLFNESITSILSFFFHMNFKKILSNFLSLKIKFERRKNTISSKFHIFSLFILIISPPNDQHFFLSLRHCIIITIRIKNSQLFFINIFLQFLSDLFFHFLVLQLSYLLNFFNGFLSLVDLQFEYISLPQVNQILHGIVLKRIIPLFFRHEPTLLNDQFIPNQLVFLKLTNSFLNSVLCN